ncbi:hypothetical protein [Shewanella violacea]
METFVVVFLMIYFGDPKLNEQEEQVQQVQQVIVIEAKPNRNK